VKRSRRRNVLEIRGYLTMCAVAAGVVLFAALTFQAGVVVPAGGGPYVYAASPVYGYATAPAVAYAPAAYAPALPVYGYWGGPHSGGAYWGGPYWGGREWGGYGGRGYRDWQTNVAFRGASGRQGIGNWGSGFRGQRGGGHMARGGQGGRRRG